MRTNQDHAGLRIDVMSNTTIYQAYAQCACSAIKNELAMRAANEFAEWLRKPRLHKMYEGKA